MNKKSLLNQSLQKPSVVEQIVHKITDAIIAGELRPGDRLPVETDLAARFGVARNSVREAVKILVAYGVLEIRRAEGTFIVHTYTQKMLDPMLYGLLLQDDFSNEIIELRKVMDIGILQLVMLSCTDKDLDQLTQTLSELETAIFAKPRDIERILTADVTFHNQIHAILNNQLLLGMYHYVDRITSPSRSRAINHIFSLSREEDFIALHQDLIHILSTKDVSRIEPTINAHYIFWNQVLPQERSTYEKDKKSL